MLNNLQEIYTNKMSKTQEELESVMEWKSLRNFIMGLTCWAIGLGSCWRFPEAASQQGGGAFLIPYVIETIFIGIPFTFMEMGLGQFSNKGPIGIWNMAPLWRGIGYATSAVLVLVMVYYNVICGYLLYFMFASMATVLPWMKCNPSWSEVNCFHFGDNSSIHLACVDKYGANFCAKLHWENSAEHYYRIIVLGLNSKGTNQHTIRWNLLYCSIATAFIVFLVTFQGTKSLERIVAFFAIFPYVEMVVLLFVALLDPGSSRGLKAFLTPAWNKIKSISPWIRALQHIVFSMGLGLGGLIMMGSRCHFRNPVHIEVIAINLVDIASSMCYAIAIFCILGAMSYDLNLPMEEIMKWKGPLLFSKVPLALGYLLGISQLWSIIFFSSVYILGLRSLSFMMATTLGSIYDAYPKMMKYMFQCSACASLLLVLLGCPYLTPSGSAYLDRVAEIIVGPALLMVCFLETIGIVCIYGVTHFIDDMHFMLGFRSSVYWQIFWALSPLTVFTLLIYKIIEHVEKQNAGQPQLLLTKIIHWVILVVPVLFLFISIMWRIMTQRKKFKCSSLFDPSPSWGPKDPILKKSREMFTAHAMTEEYMYRQTRVKEKIKMQNEEDYGLE